MKLLFKIISPLLCLLIGAFVVFYIDQTNTIPTPSGMVISGKVCEHKLEPSTCAFCDPSLIESLGFCHGHGVPEAFCTRCNSSLIVAFKHINDWCTEHGLPESQCQKCKKEIKKNKKTPVKTGLKLFKKTIFRSQKNPSNTCKNEDVKIQFINADILKHAGIEVSKLVQNDDNDLVTSNAQINYNQNKLAHITPRAKGILSNIVKDLGDKVIQDELLAQIHSNDFSTAKSEYFQALTLVKLWQKNHESELALQKDGATSAREVLQTQTKLVESQISLSNSVQKLRNLGLSDQKIKDLNTDKSNNSYLNILAPFAGTIVKRHAVSGEMVDTSHSLFTIVNTTTMWASLDIHPKDLTKIKIGQTTQISIDELSPMIFTGKILWIDTAVNESSRTLKARIELKNPQNLLKSGMYGQAKIVIKSNQNSLLVHKSSVQWDGCCNVVFVKSGPTSFKTKRVRLKPSGKDKNYYLIQGDLKVGDEVATTGSFLLKTEILKDNIGAGCCEADAGK